MLASRREIAGLGAALVVHAAVFALLARAPTTVTAQPTVPPPAVDVELAFEPETAEPLAPTALPSSPEPIALLAPRAASRARDTGPVLPDSAPAPPPSTDVPLDVRAPLALSADALGLGGRNVFLGALPDGVQAPTPERAPANVAPGVQQSLRDALHEHDHGIGLDIGGPIISVAESLARPSATPMNSRAVFQVTADSSGNVTDVGLVDASQGRAEWEKVAASLREALRSRKLHVPEGTGGVTMTIEVTSRWQLPSGHDPDTEVSVLGIPLKKASKESKQPMKVAILKPDLKVVQAPSDPGAPGSVKMPQYQLHIVDLLNLDVDPTDLTPRPLRVVHARVLREKVL